MKKNLRFIAFLAASHGLLHTTATASSLEWKGSTTGLTGGTDQTWDTNTTANWWNGSSTVNWPALGGTDDDAVFGGTAGTVTITTATANDITFNTSGYTLSGGTLTLNGTTPTITIGSGNGATISSTINGSSGLVKSGGGGLNLSGANGYSGGTTLSGGAITVGNNSALGSGTLTMNGGTLTAGVGPTTTLSNSLQIDGSGSVFNAPSGANLELNGNMTGSGSVSVAGQWAVSLGGENSGFTGTWTSGSENPNNITSFANANSGSASAAWVLNGGRMVNGAGSSPTISLGSLSGSGGILSNNTSGQVTFSVGGLNTDTTFSGQIQNEWGGGGTTAITKVGTGQWTLTGNNSHSGGTTISGGTIVVGNNSALGSGTIVMNGGTLRAGVSGTTNLANNIQIDGTGNVFHAPFGSNLQLNGNMSGSGSVSVAGEWAVALGGDNSGFAGTWTSGSENPNNITRFNAANSGSAGAQWALNGGRMVNSAGSSPTISLGALSGTGGILSNDTGGTVTYSIGALNLDTTFTGQIQNEWGGGGTTAITKTGTGQWTVGGNNSYTGGTTISGGTILVTHNSALGSGTIVMNGGALKAGVSGTTYLANNIQISGTGNGFNAPIGSNLELAGSLSGSGTVSVNGGWAVALVGSNSGFSGTWITGSESSSNLTRFDTADSGSASAAWELNGGRMASQAAGGSTISLGSLSGTGGILSNNTSGQVTFSIGGMNTDSTFGGQIENAWGGGGTTAITKVGTGKLTLAGTHNYSGATTVSAGTLSVSGSIGSSDVTVNGGILASGSTGTVGKTVNVNSGATLAAGGVGSVGAASVASNLNFGSGSIFDWDLNTGSNTYDTVGVSGTLAITTGAVFNVASSTTFTDTFWNTSHTWSDIFGGKAIDNFLVANFLYSGSATAPAAEGYFTVSGSSLSWTAVPEPTSALAGLLLTAGLLRRRRR